MDEASGGSSVGEAVSGRGDGVVNEEDVYYIPERRPSLDLGSYPMEFNLRYWCHSTLVFVSLGLFTKCSARRFIRFLEYQLYLRRRLLTYMCFFGCHHLLGTSSDQRNALLRLLLLCFFFRIGEGRVVGPAPLPAPSYGSLRSEQRSYSMDHNDEADTRYRHFQQQVHRFEAVPGNTAVCCQCFLNKSRCSLWL